jgi:hypothetical protein
LRLAEQYRKNHNLPDIIICQMTLNFSFFLRIIGFIFPALFSAGNILAVRVSRFQLKNQIRMARFLKDPYSCLRKASADIFPPFYSSCSLW